MTERKIIHQDKDRIEVDLNRAESAANKLSQLSSLYARMEIGEITSSELFTLIKRPETAREFVKRKASALVAVPAGIDPTQFREMVQMPAGADQFLSMITQVGYFVKGLQKAIGADPRALFSIEGDQVKLAPDTAQKITDMHTHYARSKNEYQAFLKLTEVVKILNEVRSLPAGFAATTPGRGCIKLDGDGIYHLSIQGFRSTSSFTGMDKL